MRLLLIVVLFSCLVGCGDDVRAPAPAPTSTLLDDQKAAMEKAKAVEAQNLDHKRKMDEQLDGGG